MTTGDLTALFSYATQILMALMMLSMVFTMITISLASAHRIAEVLEEKTDIANPTSAEMTVRDGSICFEQVSFAYSTKADKKALSNYRLRADRWHHRRHGLFQVEPRTAHSAAL